MSTKTDAKVTLKDASVTEAKAEAPGDEVLTDSRGRRLKIKQPDVLSESRLVRLMGEAATNTAYMYGYVIPAVNVVEIDGDAVGFPMSLREIEALISRLGREGLSCVLAHHTESLQKEKTDPENELKN